MTEDIKSLISELRGKRYLNAPSEEDLTTIDIIDAINDVQRKIFAKASIEKVFKINLIKDKPDYDFTLRECLKIKVVFTSWNGQFEMMDNTKWDSVKDSTGPYPLKGTIFERRLRLAPAPSLDNGSYIEIWAYQTDLVDPVDDKGDIELEIPATFKLALKLGVVSEFDKNRYPEFIDELNRKKASIHVKETRNKQSYPNW